MASPRHHKRRSLLSAVVLTHVAMCTAAPPSLPPAQGMTYCGSGAASDLTMANVPYHQDVVDFGKAICDAIGGVCTRLREAGGGERGGCVGHGAALPLAARTAHVLHTSVPDLKSNLARLRALPNEEQNEHWTCTQPCNRPLKPLAPPCTACLDAAGDEYGLACEHAHSCCILLARRDTFMVDGQWHTWIDYDRFQDLVRAGQPFTAKGEPPARGANEGGKGRTGLIKVRGCVRWPGPCAYCSGHVSPLLPPPRA